MNRRLWNTLVAFMWLVLPAMALRYWQLWDQLPAYVATHFDAAGRANGWMPRAASLAFTLGFMAFMLAVFTVILYVLHRKYPPSKLSWALLAFFCVEIWTIFFMLSATLEYSHVGTPGSLVPLMVVTPIGAFILLAITVGEKRGSALPSSDVLAEEVQSGRPWSLVFAVPLLAAIWVVVAMPHAQMRLGAVLLGMVFLAVFGMTWDGFHYLFTRHGLEIRTLGFRLKSIPAADIERYAVEKWNPICGYGIRGVGNRKAYVWTGKGVLVHLRDGVIFLGHSDPARIMQDLDFMKQSQQETGAAI
jgi:Domain of unknown function (DUF1648)